MAGRQDRCARCGSPLAIPTVAISSEGDDEYTLQAQPHEQWFVCLTGGQQIGPVTIAELDAACGQGRIPPQALVRRGDWEQGLPLASFIARRQADAEAAARQAAEAQRRAAMPYGSYGEQFARNPLGTFLAGPQMPEYRASQNPDVRAHRWRVFWRWVYVLLAMPGGAIALPLLAGLLRLAPADGVLGAGVALFLAFWPVVFFLIGMLMFAGAHFEWSWFMNARRMRAMRAGGGDSMARGFYVWTGGIIMGLAAAASVVMTIGVAGLTLTGLFDWEKMQAEHAARQARENLSDEEFRKLPTFQESRSPLRERDAAPAETEDGPSGPTWASAGSSPDRPAAAVARGSVQDLTPLEAVVTSKRRLLDQTLAQLEQQLALIRQTEHRLAGEHRSLRLVDEFTEQVKRAGGLRSNVAVARLEYREAIARLEKIAAERDLTSSVPAQERARPAPADPPLLLAETTPAQDPRGELARVEAELAECEAKLAAFQRFCEGRSLDIEGHFRRDGRIEKARDHLQYLAEAADRARTSLKRLESEWDVASQARPERPARDRVAEFIAAQDAKQLRQAAGLGLVAPDPFWPTSVEELEERYRQVAADLERETQSARSWKLSLEKLRMTEGVKPEHLAGVEKTAAQAEKRVEVLTGDLARLKEKLAEACRRENRASELLEGAAK